MRKAVIALIVAVAGTTWWVSVAPRPEIEITPSITIDRSTVAAIAAVARSADFVATLEQFSSSVPKFDEQPVVYADSDSRAPEWRPGARTARRPIVVRLKWPPQLAVREARR